MAEPSWQEHLRLRLAERNAREATFKPIIDQCARVLYDPPFMGFTPIRPQVSTANQTPEGAQCFSITCRKRR